MQTPVLEPLFKKITSLQKRDTDTGIFLCILRNFKRTFFEEHLVTAASFVVFFASCCEERA